MVLAVASAVGGENRPWAWIIGSAGFIVIHTTVSASRERSIVRRLGRNYDQVQRRAVLVISDLGQLSGDQFGLWMVDVYLSKIHWAFTARAPFLLRERVLSREISVSLVDARSQPPLLDKQAGPHGKCFHENKSLLWINEKIHGKTPDNAWAAMEPSTNEELSESYGVLNVSPLVDQLGRGCVGVLAIHVKPEGEVILKALGALRSPHGLHRINRACVELQGLLVR